MNITSVLSSLNSIIELDRRLIPQRADLVRKITDATETKIKGLVDEGRNDLLCLVAQIVDLFGVSDIQNIGEDEVTSVIETMANMLSAYYEAGAASFEVDASNTEQTKLVMPHVRDYVAVSVGRLIDNVAKTL